MKTLADVRLSILLIVCSTSLLAQPPLRQAASQRALLIGAAAQADEFGPPNKLTEEAGYATTLAAQFNMLEAENAMKWNPIHPSRSTYNFTAGDKLVAFAQANGMKMRGHNRCWWSFNPSWVTTFAQTASTADMSGVFKD